MNRARALLYFWKLEAIGYWRFMESLGKSAQFAYKHFTGNKGITITEFKEQLEKAEVTLPNKRD